eukprot:13304901-Alexandrium_andersonii.AAC.1
MHKRTAQSGGVHGRGTHCRPSPPGRERGKPLGLWVRGRARCIQARSRRVSQSSGGSPRRRHW